MSKFVVLVYSPVFVPRVDKNGKEYNMEIPSYEALGPFKTEDDASKWLQWIQSADGYLQSNGEDPLIVPLSKPKKSVRVTYEP